MNLILGFSSGLKLHHNSVHSGLEWGSVLVWCGFSSIDGPDTRLHLSLFFLLFRSTNDLSRLPYASLLFMHAPILLQQQLLAAMLYSVDSYDSATASGSSRQTWNLSPSDNNNARRLGARCNYSSDASIARASLAPRNAQAPPHTAIRPGAPHATIHPGASTAKVALAG